MIDIPKELDETRMYQKGKEEQLAVKMVLASVYEALAEKGYDPINQLVGYLLSGDPAYITSHNNARTRISRLEREDIMRQLVESYLHLAE